MLRYIEDLIDIYLHLKNLAMSVLLEQSTVEFMSGKSHTSVMSVVQSSSSLRYFSVFHVLGQKIDVLPSDLWEVLFFFLITFVPRQYP